MRDTGIVSQAQVCQLGRYGYFKSTAENITHNIEEIKESERKLHVENACYHSVQCLLSSHIPSKNIKIRVHKSINLLAVLQEYETCSLTLSEENMSSVFENRVLKEHLA